MDINQLSKTTRLTRMALTVALNNYRPTRYYTLKLVKIDHLKFLDTTFILHDVKFAELSRNSFE